MSYYSFLMIERGLLRKPDLLFIYGKYLWVPLGILQWAIPKLPGLFPLPKTVYFPIIHSFVKAETSSENPWKFGKSIRLSHN